jgi:hypothetical protein
MGNYSYIIRSQDYDELMEAARYITARENNEPGGIDENRIS